MVIISIVGRMRKKMVKQDAYFPDTIFSEEDVQRALFFGKR